MSTPAIYGIATPAASNAYVAAIAPSAAPASISVGVLVMCRMTPAAQGALMTLPPNLAFGIDSDNNLLVTDISAVVSVIPLGAYLDTWLLITATVTSGVLYVYLNGVLSLTLAVVTPVGAPTFYSFAFDAALSNVIAGGFWSGTALTQAQHQALAESTFATGSLSGARAVAQHVYLADRGMRPSLLTWPDEGSVGGAPLLLAAGTTPLPGLVTAGDFLVPDGNNGGSGGDPNVPQGNRTYYVSSTGDDTANGLTQATAFLTIDHAISLIPFEVAAVYEVVILDVGPFAWNGVPPRTYRDNGVIYVRSDVDDDSLVNGLQPATAATGASTTTVVKAAAGWVVDGFVGKWVEIVVSGGAAQGDIRQIHSNTADTIVPVVRFSAAPSANCTFRVFEPSTEIDGNISSGFFSFNGPATAVDLAATGLGIERLKFLCNGGGDGIRTQGRVSFYVCSMDGHLGQLTNAASVGDTVTSPLWSQVVLGIDAKMPSLIHALALNSAYNGAGVLMTAGIFGGWIVSPCVGYLCATDVLVQIVAGKTWFRGGRFILGLTVSGLRNNTVVSAPMIDTGAKLTIDGPGLNVNHPGALCEFVTAVVIVGATYGVRARFGGRVVCSGNPTNVTGGVANLAAGEVPATAAALAAIGDFISELDGSVIQRVS